MGDQGRSESGKEIQGFSESLPCKGIDFVVEGAHSVVNGRHQLVDGRICPVDINLAAPANGYKVRF